MAQLLTAPDEPMPLPGAGFFFEVDQPTTVPVSRGSVVFVPFTADWGPVNTPVMLRSYRQYAAGGRRDDGSSFDGFGPSDTVGRRRVFGAFLGEGLAGKGGASAVVAYRMATAAAAKAELTLENTTPADALTLTARYEGTRGNGLGITHRPGSDVGTDELVLLEGGREVEAYTYAAADVADLAAQINANPSSLVTAESLVSGVALDDIANEPLVGGVDGTGLLVADYTAMLDAIAYEPFGVFAAAGVTDAGVIAALYAWQEEVAALGKPFFLVEGGPAAETFAAHKTRALARDSSDAMNFGTGSIADSTLTDDGTEVVISTAEGVTRVAGAIARRGETADMINVRFVGWRVVGGMTLPQEKIAALSGMTGLTRDGDPEAPTKIRLGVTSYSSDTTAKPRWHYGVVKFVRIDHGLENDIASDQENGDLIGELGQSSKSRDLVLGRAKDILQRRIDRGILQPRSTVMLDPDFPPDDNSDEVALAYDVWDVRGISKIRNRIRLH